jgi:vacuolar-type H+-ATPase subunit I/STV1
MNQQIPNNQNFQNNGVNNLNNSNPDGFNVPSPNASMGISSNSQNPQNMDDKKKGVITIGAPSKPKGPTTDEKLGDVLNQFRSFATRVRSVEERVGTLRKSIQNNEQNVVDMNKKLNIEIQKVSTDLMDVKRDISNMKNKLELIIKELGLTAKKEDVDVLNKYLELWSPVKFVTQNEVRKVVIKILYELGLDDDLDRLEKNVEEDESNISRPETIDDEY